MWRPPSVFMGCADTRELFSPRDSLADFQTRESVSREVAVQSEKIAGVFDIVFENHQRPVIQRRSIIREHMYHALERRANQGARLDKKIHSQVNSPALLQRVGGCTEQR